MRSRLPLLLVALALGACTGQIRDTTTARSATETLLLSTAAERAVARLDTTTFTGRRVLLETSFLACVDREYVVSCLRAHLGRSGVALVDGPDAADAILEVRCATLGCWEGSYTIGIPSLPIGFGGIMSVTPPINTGFDSIQGWAKLEAFAWEPRTRRLLWSSGPLWGSSREDLFGTVYPDSLLDRVSGGATRQARKLGERRVDPDSVAEPPPAWPAPLVNARVGVP